MNMLAMLAALTVFRVDPWCNVPFLPDADPAGGVVTDAIDFAAAKGEIEAVSFVVRPDADYEKVDVVPSDLKGPDGATIPASAADVALVKVWFRPDSRWNSSWSGNQAKPTLINNLVLHDDALVKVDFENKINYLRGSYPDGPVYLDMSHTDLQTHLNNDCEPIHDAPKFVPFDLRKDFRQQYLVTWKVPKDAKPGEYKGTIDLKTSKAQNLKQLSIRLTVYPFALPRPRTHYDTSEPYVSFWMGSPSLAGLLAEGHRLDRAEKKLRAIFRSMAEHNAINLSGVGNLKVDSMDDYGLRTLIIARQEGLCADPLINGMAFENWGAFVWNPGGKLREREDAPEDFQKSLDMFREKVVGQNAIMDKYLGHHRCYYSSGDECGVGFNRRSYAYWDIVHSLGGKIWTDYAYAKDSGVFIDINDVPACVSAEEGWSWRTTGAKAVTYASTFTGPENPDVWRRIKGLRFWYADFDGQHEYCFFDGRANRWNDFVHYDRYCQFGIVYWTDDGLVSTLAWEAVREALDDVRYFTLLRRRAEAALKSSDPATRKLGRDALVWQDGVEPEEVIDLNAFRRETVGWIEKLIAKVGQQPEDKDTELPPPAELPPDGRWQKVPKPSAGAKEVFAYVKTMAGESGSWNHGEGRYDLAIAALDGLLADAGSATPDRVKAAMRKSELHSAMQERREAVAAVETALKIKNITSAERGKLLLLRVKALMTDEKFEENYTVKQLDEASVAIAAALKFPGATEEERFGAIYKMCRGYLGAKAYEKCVDYAEARMKDTRISPAHQADLFITMGEALNYLEEWERALKAFKEAHRAYNNDGDKNFRRKILVSEAKAAEMAKDYNRAVACWTDIIPTYDSQEEKSQINAAKRNVARLSAIARKNNKISMGSLDDDDSAETISLDE